MARQATGRCLVLEGPPAVLLDMAGIASESEAVSEVDASAEPEAAE